MWAGRTAIELARTWGDSGQRVFLGDVCFRSPILHDLLGEPASPNLADVILRQVRLQEVVRSVVAGSFLFAPACPADAEAPPVVGDVGWEGLIAGFAEVGATVFFFADKHVPGLGQILEASGTVFVLSASGAVDLPPEVATRVGAVLQPPALEPTHVAPEPPVDEPDPSETPPGAAEPLSGGLEELLVELPLSDEPSPVGATPKEPDLVEPDLVELVQEEPSSPTPDEPATQVAFGGGGFGSTLASGVRRTLAGLTIGVIVLLTIWILWPDAEGSGPAVSNEPPPATSAPASPASADDGSGVKEASEAGTPTPTQPATSEVARPASADDASNDDPALEYSLALASFRDPQAARRRAEVLGRRHPRVAFIVAPVRVGGTAYHRLLAVATGVDEARALRDSIDSVTAGDDRNAWIVRRTPLAFELAVVSDVEAARALVARAESQGVFAYIVAQHGADQPIYSVLAGAYEGEEEAAAMRDLLANAGYADAGLKSRVGRMVR
ncbi:MAG: hypothetical protein BMS9Abin29_0491 [Gemmatimonadota bacterium]|nr:MAG: hypothetical protein BMS9Abin29_0491 [Gemmatimonadota bacterium]